MDCTDFYVKQLSQLNGWTVGGPVVSPPDELLGDRFFGLAPTKNGASKILWILRDDEGNGPGSFEIQDV